MTVLTSRQRVVEFQAAAIRQQPPRSDMALICRPRTVRHHLAILTADGRVSVAGVESKGKRGRPDKMYRLSEKVLGEGFDVLSEALLMTWLEGLPVSRQEAALAGLAEAVTAKIGEARRNTACH